LLVIAGGIILAVLFLALIGPIITLVVSIFWFLFGVIVIIIIFVFITNNLITVPPELITLFIIGALIIAFTKWLVKNQSKMDYAGSYIYCYYKYKFLRFSKQSKINYFKNLELEKIKIDINKKEEGIKLIAEQEKQRLLEEKSNYNKKIKHFNILLVDLKELEKNINPEIFIFSYKEVSAQIKTKTSLEERASSFVFSNHYALYSVMATGSNFNNEKIGDKKEILNWTIEEIGKILANFENHDK